MKRIIGLLLCLIVVVPQLAVAAVPSYQPKLWIDQRLNLGEHASSAPTPPAGQISIYAKTNHGIYFKNSDGDEFRFGTDTLNIDKINSDTGLYFSYKPNGLECTDGQSLTWVAATDRWVCGTGAGTVAVDDVTSGSGKYFSYKPNNIECADGESLTWVAATDRWTCGSGGSGFDPSAIDVPLVFTGDADISSPTEMVIHGGNAEMYLYDGGAEFVADESPSDFVQLTSPNTVLFYQNATPAVINFMQASKEIKLTVPAAGSIASSYTMTLPGVLPNDGDCLKINSSGQMDFDACNSGGFDPGAVAESFIPDTPGTYDFGSEANPFNIAYLNNVALKQNGSVNFYNVDNTKQVQMYVNDDLSAGYSMLLPEDPPSDNDCIKIMASGQMSFAPCSSGAVTTANNTYQFWRNAADDTDVGIIKFNGSDESIFGNTGYTTRVLGNIVSVQGGSLGVHVYADNNEVKILGNLSNQVNLQLFDADYSNYIGFKTPAAVTSSYTMTLPPDDGTTDQAMITDGSGVLTFGSPKVDVDDIVSSSGKYLSYMPNGIECGSQQILKWNSTDDRWECAASVGTLANNTYQVARNAANDGDVNLFKVDGSDNLYFGQTGSGHSIFFQGYDVWFTPDRQLDLYSGHNEFNIIAATSGDRLANTTSVGFSDGTQSQYFRIRAADSMASTFTMTWPSVGPTAGQILLSSGTNNFMFGGTDSVSPVLDTKDNGTAGSTNDTGSITVKTGNTNSTVTDVKTGGILIKTGDSSGTHSPAGDSQSGSILMNSGSAVNGFSGSVQISSGASAYQSGDVTVRSGDGTIDDDGFSGDLFLQTGTVTGGTAQAGSVKIQPGTNPDDAAKNGHIEFGQLTILKTNATDKPACSADYRGATYYTPGGAGVADLFEVCTKDAADAYAWHAVY